MSFRIMSRMAVMLTWMMVLSGCMSINAPKTVTYGGEGKGEAKKIGKTDAVLIAQRVAREEGQNAKNFEVTEQKTSEGWWVLFDHKISGYKLGWPYHFAVHVTLDGKATLYKNN
jgi:hypothetical protein